jgi:thymidylate synthase (FAD)
MTLKPQQINEINIVSQQKNQTLRPVSQELEKILYQPFYVLDHGFVRVIDYMGNDSSVVQAARVSYGSGTKQINADIALINYLMAHKHTTPFEMCELKLHIKLPIFIARQWVRHRTASINEYSARYSILEDEFYIPKAEHLSPQSKVNHQGRNFQNSLNPVEQQEVLDILIKDSQNCYQNYLHLINQNPNGETINENKQGLARELARMNLTLNCYTQWYWKINLHNLLHFLKLRVDSHAQYEIRVYAEIILDIVKQWVPHSYNAFVNYQQNSKNFSQNALAVLQKLLHQQPVSQETSGLSQREWQELVDFFKLNI